MRRKALGVLLAALAAAIGAAPAAAQLDDHAAILAKSREMVPSPPWPAGDQRGMANTQGPGTWLRCAHHLADPEARAYELSHVRSESMPVSPFGVPLKYEFRATAGLPGTRHAFNGETISGEPGAQVTQMDGIGHFGYLPQAWSGEGEFPSEQVVYYGGYTQKDVKPTPDSPLLKLGMEHVPPLVTSAVLLDARSYLGKGAAMKPGTLVTAADIEGMLAAQGLAERGLLAGDVLYIYTGWEDNWQDPDVDKRYYAMGPGLSYDAVKYLGEKAIALVALDNPFTDPATEGQIFGKGPAPEGTPADLPFVIHHHNLTQSGVHQIQNARLAEMARDGVWLSCTMILALRERGASGSPVRPVAVGAPRNN